MSKEKKVDANKTAAAYADFMQEVINGIDVTKNAQWAAETREISKNIREALVKRIVKMENDKAGDDKFMDYCNGIKALLAIYNFGNLDTEELLVAQKATDSAIAACVQRREGDKAIIKAGIAKILKHVKTYGFDITPNLDRTACQEIFGDDNNRVVPITISAAAVFTTLVYFRRSFKRIKLFTEEELMYNGLDLTKMTMETVSDIMYLFYDFAYNQKTENMFMGWGVTLDRNYTKAVTLSDTYAVVDALGRFADAFTKKGDKRDDEFINGVDECAVAKGRYVALTDRCLESTYKTAFNVYERTKGVYGKSVFYSDCAREGDNVRYTYTKTSYEQIASSSRSSALFNPLYVAMITMYGYNDKEVVIRRFMDSPELVGIYYDKYEKKAEADAYKISDYAAQMDDYDGDFYAEKDLLLSKHSAMSKSYSLSVDKIGGDSGEYERTSWRNYYRIARVFQKYLEDVHPDELMKISDYRDYLNATKDAIDQVQVMYRDFDNHQRLGVVDTDYAMFTALDVAVTGEDTTSIAKLNKANIAVNNLRPMLLSSKVMIVNALTKYPQADMSELYNAIKESRYSVFIRRKNAEPTRDTEWVWNEDSPDMNSTARHCEAITYDYFDYYDKYELGFRAVQSFRKDIGNVSGKSIDLSDGSLIVNNNGGFGQLQQLVMEITRQNVELIKKAYQKHLEDKQKEIDDAKLEIEKYKQNAKQQFATLERSYRVGEQIRGIIKEEIVTYVKDTLAMSILNILNGNRSKSTFRLSKLLNKPDEIVDADIEAVRSVWKDIVETCNSSDVKSGEQAEKIKSYEEAFKGAIDIQEMIIAATMLENNYYTALSDEESLDITQRNEKIKASCGWQRRNGRLPDIENEDENN